MALVRIIAEVPEDEANWLLDQVTAMKKKNRKVTQKSVIQKCISFAFSNGAFSGDGNIVKREIKK